MEGIKELKPKPKKFLPDWTKTEIFNELWCIGRMDIEGEKTVIESGNIRNYTDDQLRKMFKPIYNRITNNGKFDK